jgi:N-acetylglucosaminyl-diphospho-decaprenol L-rhamnosyltransferase
VVVVTFNSRAAVERSLPPLVAQLEPGDELVVVDNASADGTPEAVRDLAPHAIVLEPERNVGFAAACNAGAAAGSGELVVLLNPDAVPSPGFGEAIRRPALDARGWAAWMGLVTAEDGAVVNTGGGVIHFTGIAWAGGSGRPATGIEPGEVGFLSGACMAIPRRTWERFEGFPESFFLYHEDVDLSLRLRLAGGRLGIEPAAKVDHEYEFAKGPEKWRYLERNRWATVIRTYPLALIVLLAPALLATELALLVLSTAGGWGSQKLRAYGQVLRWLPRLVRERRAIQGSRRIPATEFAAAMTADLSSPYVGRLSSVPGLGAALRAYWSVVRALLGSTSSSAPSSSSG